MIISVSSQVYWYSQVFLGILLDLLDWDKALSFNDVDKEIAFFSDTLMNIMQNFLPDETIICDDRDPPWINKEIKQLIEQKNHLQTIHLK